MRFNDFCVPGTGERFKREDGTNRQDELARCARGEPIRLLREPENPHDDMAVAIVGAREIRVGHLSRERARLIGSKIECGYDVRAIVERLKGGHLPDAVLDIVLRINMEGDDPELNEYCCGGMHLARWAETDGVLAGPAIPSRRDRAGVNNEA